MSNDVRESMDSQLYIEAGDLGSLWEPDSGDQCLILADIVACFKDCNVIVLPYPCPMLSAWLVDSGKIVLQGLITEDCDAAYWGTPTVVNDKALFKDSVAVNEEVDVWTKEHERACTRMYTAACVDNGLSVIVTGLGSGDISPKERIEDMGGGHVVSHKFFGEFEDWVIMRRLK